jgi:hypothetical protein
MPLVCISIYLKSVLKHNFVVLDTCNTVTTFTWVRMWGSVVIFRSQKRSTIKKVWETLICGIFDLVVYNTFTLCWHKRRNQLSSNIQRTSQCISAGGERVLSAVSSYGSGHRIAPTAITFRRVSGCHQTENELYNVVFSSVIMLLVKGLVFFSWKHSGDFMFLYN